MRQWGSLSTFPKAFLCFALPVSQRPKKVSPQRNASLQRSRRIEFVDEWAGKFQIVGRWKGRPGLSQRPDVFADYFQFIRYVILPISDEEPRTKRRKTQTRWSATWSTKKIIRWANSEVGTVAMLYQRTLPSDLTGEFLAQTCKPIYQQYLSSMLQRQLRPLPAHRLCASVDSTQRTISSGMKLIDLVIVTEQSLEHDLFFF